MKFFTFSEVCKSPYGGYEQTLWCADNGTRVRKMWQSDGEPSYMLSGDYYTADGVNDNLLTAFVVAWQDAWQHDEELESEARAQTERYGFFVSLNAFRRTWGTYWVSGDRPAWLADAWGRQAWRHDNDLESDARLLTEQYVFFIAPGTRNRTCGTSATPGDYPESK